MPVTPAQHARAVLNGRLLDDPESAVATARSILLAPGLVDDRVWTNEDRNDRAEIAATLLVAHVRQLATERPDLVHLIAADARPIGRYRADLQVHAGLWRDVLVDDADEALHDLGLTGPRLRVVDDLDARIAQANAMASAPTRLVSVADLERMTLTVDRALARLDDPDAAVAAACADDVHVVDDLDDHEAGAAVIRHATRDPNAMGVALALGLAIAVVGFVLLAAYLLGRS